MNKPVMGLLLGAILGVFDGATAWFTPEVRPMIFGIIIRSHQRADRRAGGRHLREESEFYCGGHALGWPSASVLAWAVAAMPSETGKRCSSKSCCRGAFSEPSSDTPRSALPAG